MNHGPELESHVLPALLAAGGGGEAGADMRVTVVVAISAGVLLLALARRFGLPGIVVLLAGGVALGPMGVGVVQPASLGGGLLLIVSIAVGLILFEGGLTLDVGGYRTAPGMIKRLLTVGVVTTWLVTAGAIMLVFGLPADQSIVAASLVIVTGPTVIAPLLKRIRVNAKINSILHWEGVLIDPIGVFIAVLCFEWISGASGQQALANIGLRIAGGLAVGLGGGLVLTLLVKRRVLPEDMVNIVILACAVLLFGVAEAIRSETGLLALTVAGFVLGLSGSHRVEQIRRFKGELTDLLIGTLFILLAARLEFEQFRTFGWRGALVVAIVIFAVRPLSIMLCSIGTDLTRREKTLLSWVAPRGIVAASMASLFAISMEELGGFENPRFAETFTYSVIIATIVLQGTTAGRLAGALGLRRPDPKGWLVVGAHAFGRRLASFIARRADLPVIVVDTNAGAVAVAQREGLTSISGDARDRELRERPEVQSVGNVLALTDNEDLNVRLCEIWSRVVGSDHVYRCNPSAPRAATEGKGDDADEEAPGIVIWPGLPRPSLISGELIGGEATMREIDEGQPVAAWRAMPIVRVADGRIQFVAQQADDAEELVGPALVLDRSADYLGRSIRPELITTLDVTDRRVLFEELVGRISALYQVVPKDETVTDLLEREGAIPSALGQEVAVPHAYVGALEHRVCAIARIPNGIDLGAHDGKPVRLVFLLLSPPDDPEGHLATLAEIARKVIAPDDRERLLSAAAPLDVLRIVRETRPG